MADCATCQHYVECSGEDTLRLTVHCGRYTPAPQPRQVAEWKLECYADGTAALDLGEASVRYLVGHETLRKELGITEKDRRTFTLHVCEPEAVAVRPWVKLVGLSRLTICPNPVCSWTNHSSRGIQRWTACPSCAIPFDPQARNIPE